MIVVHGGGFINGDKQTYVKPLFGPLTGAGFAWFTINYRLAPQHPFPAAVEDVVSAVRNVRAHAKEYKVDAARIALVGESAGGHLVSFVGAKCSKEVAAVVSFYAPHDFEARERARGAPTEPVRKFLALTGLDEASIAERTGPARPGGGLTPGVWLTAGPGSVVREAIEKMRAASPITHVHRGMPPYLLIHGTADAQVPYEQSPSMCARMKAAGAACEVFTVDGGPHGVERWETEPAHQNYKSKMIEWLKATLR